MSRHPKTSNPLQIPEQLKGQERCFGTSPLPVQTRVWNPEILLKDLQEVTNEEGLKPEKSFFLSRGRKRSHLRPDCSFQWLFLGVQGTQSPVQWISTYMKWSQCYRPIHPTCVLYEQRWVHTTVCLGCFSFRDSLRMVEPARSRDSLRPSSAWFLV